MGSNTGRGMRVTARWCASCATLAGAGGLHRSAGRTAAPTSGGRPLGEADKPWLLRGEAHGTQVVLLGQHEQHDTTQAPRSVTEARRQWITRYLNSRFLRLPEQVEVLVRDHHGRGEPGPLREVHGESHHVEQRAQDAGSVELSDAIVHWWVLDDDHRGRRREATLWASTGHAAAVYGDELHDVLPQTRGGYGRLQDFGIRFGYERVVLHLEPQAPAGRLESNTARTLLLLDHEPLPWGRWGEEFTAAMPEEILRLQERAAGTEGVPREAAIRGRVSAILPLYRLSRYRPAQPRQQSPTLPATGDGAELESTTPVADSQRATGTQRRTSGAEGSQDVISGQPLGDAQVHEDHVDAIANLPDVAWISVRDGSRAPGDLEDEAARYHAARHELTINADFRAISDLTAHWRRRYQGVPGARQVIEAQVCEWCEQILVELVLAARNTSWSDGRLDALLSPTSFSAALLPRHLLHATLQKRLAQKLGPPRTGATR